MKSYNEIFSNDTNIFKSTKESRFLPNVLFTLIIAVILIFSSQILGAIIRSNISNFLDQFIHIQQSLIDESFNFTVGLICSFGTTILIFFIWVRFIEKRKIKTMGFCKENAFKNYFKGFSIGILMMGLVVVILVILGCIKFEYQSINILPSILILLCGWIIQGASEEIMVRGWLLPVIGARHNVLLGIFISSSFFAALHLLNPSITKLPIINLILFGIFAALYTMNEENLWGICGFHSAWNFAQGNLFGFKVSGISPSGGSLFNIELLKSDILTGGLFGPEGGLVVSTVLSIGIIVLFYKLYINILKLQS